LDFWFENKPSGKPDAGPGGKNLVVAKIDPSWNFLEPVLDFPAHGVFILKEIHFWGRFFVHFCRGKFCGNFSPKNVGENWKSPLKKFRKIVFPRNSEENSAENHFSRKKCMKNWPQVMCPSRGRFLTT
jgi:hypothetical protein